MRLLTKKRLAKHLGKVRSNHRHGTCPLCGYNDAVGKRCKHLGNATNRTPRKYRLTD
jgi:hypothetical protein